MKLALIPPNSLHDHIQKTDLHLILPQQMEQFPIDFVESLTGYRILDNGAAEGSSVSLNRLVRFSPWFNEIVAPDKLQDPEATIAGAHAMKDFNRFPGDSKRLNFMGVVQGTTLKRCQNTYEALLNMPWIDVIALPRIMTWNFGEAARISFLKMNYDINMLVKPIHCLGGNYKFPQEIKWLADQGIARSMDTSLPYVYGWFLKKVDGTGPSPTSRPDNYFNLALGTKQLEVTEYNVNRCIEWAQTC